MKKAVRIFWRIFFIGFGTFILLLLLANFGVFGKMPSLRELENPSMLQASEIYAEDGTLMGKYYLERGNRSNVKYRDISKHVIDALIATEDERFYRHSGIDFKSTLRAIGFAGSQGGASTITQQTAKALLDQGQGRSKATRVIEKLKEWIISVKLERNFTKEEIITLYLNIVPFSNNIYGIRNASRTFFKKEPDRLNVEEAAVLIGMLKGNTIYNPVKNPVAARDRRNVVLGQMEANKKITTTEAARLKALPIKLNYGKLDENNGYAPYFREVLRDEVRESLKGLKKPNGESYDIYKDGLKIYTTINPKMQEYAEEAVYSHVPTMQNILNASSVVKDGSVWKGHETVLEAAMKQSERWQNLEDDGLSDKEIKASFYVKVPMKVFAWNALREKDTIMTPFDSIKYHRQFMQSSFMAMDPVTGEVRAWVGGISFKTFKFDHANIKTKRQIGSTVKPLLYTQAMEERGFTPETECENQAQFFQGNGWVPSGKKCKGGMVTMASALAYSMNCATAYIMKQVGPQQFADFVARLNIPTKLQPYPSNALGACDLSLYEMCWAYTIFAGRGFSTKPYFISRIEDRNGNVIKRFDYSVNRKEAVSEITAYNMTRMMQGTVTKGTASGLMYRLGAVEMGGKTGTTDDNADAWFMGYSPQLLAGTWIGCDDRFIHLGKYDTRGQGGFAARPIWEYFFKKVYADKTLGIEKDSRFAKPAELENEINSADIMNLIDNTPPPAGEGEDQGVGNPNDYDLNNNEVLKPESKAPVDDDRPVRKDSVKTIIKDNNEVKPIGSSADDPKKKKNLLQKIFGSKKDKNR
jgi:penicillin-binding protein 1A